MSNKVDFDLYVDEYNKLLNERTQFFSASEEYFAKYKVDLTASIVWHPIRRILEYGCGIGRNIRYLMAAFPEAEIMGTDISKTSLEVAAAENPGARFEVETDDLELGPFDLVFVAGVFHHIPPPVRSSVMEVLANRLEKGGTLVIFEHNPLNPITRHIVSTCPYDEDAILLRVAELKQLTRTAGLQFLRRGYCLFIPPRFSMLTPVEKYLEWLPLGGQYWISASHA